MRSCLLAGVLERDLFVDTVETESDESERDGDLRLGLLLRPRRFSISPAESPLRLASASASCLSATPLLVQGQSKWRNCCILPRNLPDQQVIGTFVGEFGYQFWVE